MNFIENAKEIAEVVTAISAAIIVLRNAFQIIPKPIKRFFTKTISMFFFGFTNSKGKKVRFFKAIKAEKEQQEQFQMVLKTVSYDFTSEDVLILNKTELMTFLAESKLFTKITRRKS